jgi:hypothetical protein
MSGFGNDRFGETPFGIAGWSRKMLVDVWPDELRELTVERGGYLLTLCEALCPLFNAIIHEHTESIHWWNAWRCRDEDRIITGFWWDGIEFRESNTATLYADTKRVGAMWEPGIFIPKGSLYVDAAAKSWFVTDVRRGYPIDYVRSDGNSYVDLIEVDISCSRVSDVTPVIASPGTGHSILTQDGLLEWLAATIGVRWVSGLTENYRRLLVGRHHQFISMKGSVEGAAAFAKMHGYDAVVEGLYWLSAETVPYLPVGDIIDLKQSLVQYPVFWGDGVSSIVSSDGSLGTVCRHLKDDPDYRGALVEPAAGHDGDVAIEFWVVKGGVESRYLLKDRGLGIGVGNLIPAGAYPSSVAMCGTVHYATGAIVLRAYDLSTPGISMGVFARARPVLVSFKRTGQYTLKEPIQPLFDEIPADYRELDAYCWEEPIVFADATVVIDSMPVSPYTSDSIWTVRLTIPSATIEFPVLPRYGSILGAWAPISGRWLFSDGGVEHYLEQIYEPGPLDPPVAYTLIRVKGTVPITPGVKTLTYLCPNVSSCDFALSNRIQLTLTRPHPEAFLAVPSPDYDATLLSRFGETLGIQEELVVP